MAVNFDFTYLLLSAQIGLLGHIVPSVRAVTIGFNEEKKMIVFRYFYDEEINDELFDLAGCACVEVNMDPDYPFFCQFEDDNIFYLEYPKKIPIQGRLVYLRHGEPWHPEYTQERAANLWPQSIPIVILRLDLQEALLGKVTPALRQVQVDMDNNKKILKFFFYYDGEILGEDYKLANAAIVEASRHFHEFEIEKFILRLDFPDRIPVHESPNSWVVYSRREYSYFSEPETAANKNLFQKSDLNNSIYIFKDNTHLSSIYGKFTR